MANNNAKILKADRLKAEKEIKSMVTIMGNDALNHFESSFRNQGFTDQTLRKWKPRKRKERGKNLKIRNILTQTGRLRRSLKRNRIGQYAIRISTNVPYANIHNEGGTIEKQARKGVTNLKIGRDGRSRFASKKKANFQVDSVFSEHNIEMPKRQFVGYSAKLNRALINKFNMKIHSIF
jgi:phage gpG-like protein